MSARASRIRRSTVSAESCPRPDEPGPQRLDRRWKDEDGHRLGERLAHLPRALPVDVEDHVPPLREPRLERAPRGSVVPVEDPGVFEEFAGVHHRLELAPADEVVVDAVPPRRGAEAAWYARRRARRAVGIDQRAREARLPGPRGRAQHQHPRLPPDGRLTPAAVNVYFPPNQRPRPSPSARTVRRGGAGGPRRAAEPSSRVIRRSGSARASAR